MDLQEQKPKREQWEAILQQREQELSNSKKCIELQGQLLAKVFSSLSSWSQTPGFEGFDSFEYRDLLNAVGRMTNTLRTFEFDKPSSIAYDVESIQFNQRMNFRSAK